MKICVLDTGIVYALFDAGDRWHAQALAFANAYAGKLVIPQTVIPEAAYLLSKYLGDEAEREFAQALIRQDFHMEALTQADMQRVAQLLNAHRTPNIGIVDASVAAIAERLKTLDVATTDRRHFTGMQTSKGKALNLLP
jgi:uncharacterized protein